MKLQALLWVEVQEMLGPSICSSSSAMLLHAA